MAFDERVIEEFRRKIYARKVREFVEAFEEVFDRMSWLEDYQYCLDDTGKQLLNQVIDNIIRANEALDEFYWYFNEHLAKGRGGGES